MLLLKGSLYLAIKFNHSHKKWKDSLETLVEPGVLCVYVESQAKLEPILFYRAWQDSEDCL